MAQTPKKSGWLRRLARRFFGVPFRDLPMEFGEPVPPELRIFEAEAEAAQHSARQEEGSSSTEREQTHPSHQDESRYRR
jgi:hypothetical protein